MQSQYNNHVLRVKSDLTSLIHYSSDAIGCEKQLFFIKHFLKMLINDFLMNNSQASHKHKKTARGSTLHQAG